MDLLFIVCMFASIGGVLGVIASILGLCGVFNGYPDYKPWYGWGGVLPLALLAAIFGTIGFVHIINVWDRQEAEYRHQTCAPYGGVAGTAEIPHGKTSESVFMCKKGPRVIYSG